MALIALYHDDLVVQPWMTFVAYQILNIVTSGVVMFGNRFIPAINKFSCMWVLFLCGSPINEFQWSTCN